MVEPLPTGTAPLVRLIAVPLGGAITVPPQVFVRLGVELIVCPAGKLSVNCMPVNSGAPLLRVMVIVRRATPPMGTVLGENAFLTLKARLTVRLAVVVVVLLPRFVCKPLTTIVLVRLPVTALVAI